MDNKASITALMSAFGRAFHAENEEHPVFIDHLAKNLMTEEEYAAVQGYILGGAQFFEPEIDPAALQSKELLDSAGCEDVEITWGSDPVEPVEAIMQTAGLRK